MFLSISLSVYLSNLSIYLASYLSMSISISISMSISIPISLTQDDSNPKDLVLFCRSQGTEITDEDLAGPLGPRPPAGGVTASF